MSRRSARNGHRWRLPCVDGRAMGVMLLLLLDIANHPQHVLLGHAEDAIALLLFERHPEFQRNEARAAALQLVHELRWRHRWPHGAEHVDVFGHAIDHEKRRVKPLRLRVQKAIDVLFDAWREQRQSILGRPHEMYRTGASMPLLITSLGRQSGTSPLPRWSAARRRQRRAGSDRFCPGDGDPIAMDICQNAPFAASIS